VSYSRGDCNVKGKITVYIPVSCLCRNCRRPVGLATPDEEYFDIRFCSLFRLRWFVPLLRWHTLSP
jgi:hypothetical protein